MLSYFLFDVSSYLEKDGVLNVDIIVCIVLTIILIVYLMGVLIIIYKESRCNENNNYESFFTNVIKFIKDFPLSKFIKSKIAKLMKKKQVTKSIDLIINPFGYAYDQQQDIFYTIKDAWQKKYGYCSAYDENAAYFNMIIDCEPIYFNYDNKKWLIEFWKGQYGIATGCEVGVYVADKDATDGEVIFYKGVEDEDMLKVSIALIKNHKELFKRTDKHWWHTGFKVGEFSNPSDLKVKISITLKDNNMLRVFRNAMMAVGYNKEQLWIHGNTVSFIFDKPYSKQPNISSEMIERVQKKNQLLCKIYNELVDGYDNPVEKFNIIKENGDLYDILLNNDRFNI